MRAYVHPAEWSEDSIDLSLEESHHVLDVLRMKVGDSLELLDGQGKVAQAEISEVRGKQVFVKVTGSRNIDPPEVQLILMQAIAKGQKTELVIQKATEIGVSAIYPLETERSVVRIKDGKGAQKSARWDKVTVSAAKQCGTPWLPVVEPAERMTELLFNFPKMDLFLMADLDEQARPLREVIAEAKKSAPSKVGILIGPEGDLTPGEKEAARAAGAISVSLGDNVLRSETAAIYALSVLHYEFVAGGE